MNKKEIIILEKMTKLLGKLTARVINLTERVWELEKKQIR